MSISTNEWNTCDWLFQIFKETIPLKAKGWPCQIELVFKPDARNSVVKIPTKSPVMHLGKGMSLSAFYDKLKLSICLSTATMTVALVICFIFNVILIFTLLSHPPWSSFLFCCLRKPLNENPISIFEFGVLFYGDVSWNKRMVWVQSVCSRWNVCSLDIWLAEGASLVLSASWGQTVLPQLRWLSWPLWVGSQLNLGRTWCESCSLLIHASL